MNHWKPGASPKHVVPSNEWIKTKKWTKNRTHGVSVIQIHEWVGRSRSHHSRQIMILLRSEIIFFVISSLVRKSSVWEIMIWRRCFLSLWCLGRTGVSSIPVSWLVLGIFLFFFSFSSFVNLTTFGFVEWTVVRSCSLGTLIFSFPFSLETMLNFKTVFCYLGQDEVIFIRMKGLLRIWTIVFSSFIVFKISSCWLELEIS